jgi:hypothetical protein
LVTLANANCARNPESPRMSEQQHQRHGHYPKIQPSRWKPRSSKGLSKAGTKGSVAEATRSQPAPNLPARAAEISTHRAPAFSRRVCLGAGITISL